MGSESMAILKSNGHDEPQFRTVAWKKVYKEMDVVVHECRLNNHSDNRNHLPTVSNPPRRSQPPQKGLNILDS
jgi:hypothetical protein